MTSSPLEDLLHRVNNLLGTIQLQVEVARTVDTAEAMRAALAAIAESAARTHAEVQRIRGRGAGEPSGGAQA